MIEKYSPKELVTYCGIKCLSCIMLNDRRVKLANLFKKSLEELPLEIFKKQITQFKKVDEVISFISFFKAMGGAEVSVRKKKNVVISSMVFQSKSDA
jgi:hypothetical protein